MKQNIVEAKKHVDFELLTPGEPDKLFIGIFGRAGTGKTRFMATAPNLGVVPLQRKTRPTIEQILKDVYPQKRVWWPKDPEQYYRYKNPMELAMMDREESIKFYRALVDTIKVAYWSMLDHPQIETIGIDSGYTLYQLIVAAHYGRSTRFSQEKTAWEPPNTEMRQLLESLQTKHIIFTTEAKEAYEGKTALGWDEWSGYKPLGYEANCVLEARYSKDVAAVAGNGFSINVRMCQDRAELMGPTGQGLLAGQMCEFKYLAKELRPDSEIEDWEE